jgi:hypothetical protein
MAGNNNIIGNWYPPEAAQNSTLRIIFDRLYELRDQVASLPMPQPVPSYTQINQALSKGGSNPLNVNEFISNSAYLAVPIVLALPGPSSNYSNNGFLVSYQGVLWRYNGTTNVWQQQSCESFIGTHAGRNNFNANNYPLGSKYFENDRNVNYIVRVGNNNQVWGFAGGFMPVIPVANNSELNLPSDLGIYDDGFGATDETFGHTFRWFGSNNANGWDWWPGTIESGTLGWFGPFSANTNHWAAMTGANTTIVSNTGSISPYTTLNWTDNNTGAAFIQSVASGNYNGNIIAATAPTWKSGANTDTENSHTHNVNLNVSNVPVTATGNSQAVFPTNYTTGPGTAHSHNLSNNNATMNAPSEANNGLPKRLGLIIYIRR